MATSTSTVEDWLRSLGLLCYFDSFIENGYDELGICKEIGNEDLDAIGVNNPRDRADILQSVYRLKSSGASVVYFELETEPPPASSRFVSSIEQRKKFGNVDLKSRLRDRIILDKIDLTKPPYTNMDGSLGFLDELVSYYADQFYTIHDDVRHALETIWKQKTLQHSKEEQSHMIPTMTSLHSRDTVIKSPETAVVNATTNKCASLPTTPLIEPKVPDKPRPVKSQKKKETPADYLNVDTSASEELGDERKLKKGERLSKSLSSLENCMIHSTSTPESSPKQNKHGFLGAVKKIFGTRKDKSGRSSDNNLMACHIQMSEEDRVMLMTQVKKGEISIEDAVEKFKRFEETKRFMDRVCEEETPKEIDESSSPEFGGGRTKKERRSFKRKSVMRYPSDLVASEITMGEDERKELMIRVKRGEISIEEALGQLKSYEAEHKPAEEIPVKSKGLSRQSSKRFSFLNRAAKEPSSVFYDEDDDGSKSDQSHSSVDESALGHKSSKKSKKKLNKSLSSKDGSASSCEETRRMSEGSPPFYVSDPAAQGSGLGERGNKLRSSDKSPLSSNFLNQLKGAVTKPPRTLNYDYAETETKTLSFTDENAVEDTMKELNEAANSLRATSPLDEVPKCARHNRPPPLLPGSRQIPTQDNAGHADSHALMLANRPLPCPPKHDVDEGYNSLQKRKSVVPSRAAPPIPDGGDISNRPTFNPPSQDGMFGENKRTPPLPSHPNSNTNPLNNARYGADKRHSVKEEVVLKQTEYDKYAVSPPLPLRKYTLESNTNDNSPSPEKEPTVTNYDINPPLPPRKYTHEEETFERGGNQNSLSRPKRTAPLPPPPQSQEHFRPPNMRASLHVEVTDSGKVIKMPVAQTNKQNFSLKLGSASQTHDYAVLEKESPVNEAPKTLVSSVIVKETDTLPVPPGRPKKEKRRSRVLDLDDENEELDANDQRKSFENDENKVNNDLPTPPPRVRHRHGSQDKDSKGIDAGNASTEMPASDKYDNSTEVSGDVIPRKKSVEKLILESNLISVSNHTQENATSSVEKEILVHEKEVKKHSVSEIIQTSSKTEHTNSSVPVVSKSVQLSPRKGSREELDKPQLPPRPGGPKPSIKPKPALRPKPETSPENRNPPPLPPRKPSFLKATSVKKNSPPEKVVKPLAYRNINVSTGCLDGHNCLSQTGNDSKNSESVNKTQEFTDCNKNCKVANGVVPSLPQSSKHSPNMPQPAVRRCESVDEQVAKRLKAEDISLALWPYSDQDGNWGVPVHLISRYADELRKPFFQVAKALEDTRISQLQAMDKDYVAYDITTLSEEPEEFHSVSDIDDWLINLGLPMYINNFLSLNYGSDSVPFLTEEHLRYAGVVDPRHLKILVRSIDALR